jgi:hypothetical protein
MRTRTVPLVGLVLVLGCGEPAIKHAPVSGTVTMDGKPLPNVAVSFQPIGDTMNPGAGSSARTNERGEYTLQVIGGGPGAVIGWHRVEINPPVEGPPEGRVDDDRHSPLRFRIHPRYNLRSELKFEVKPGPNEANFDLKSK